MLKTLCVAFSGAFVLALAGCAPPASNGAAPMAMPMGSASQPMINGVIVPEAAGSGQ